MKTNQTSLRLIRRSSFSILLSLLASCGGRITTENKESACDSTAMLMEIGPDVSGIKDDEAGMNTEEYSKINENEFKEALQNPLSTFSIDVDKASYSNVRRFLSDNMLPPPDAVRIEEMVNYFTYDYPQPQGEDPFSITTEMAGCPWNKEHRLVHIGIQGKKLDYDHLKPSNLVFLIDVSGSMDDPNKLPLLKQAMKMLVEQLGKQDKVALVTYAGNAGLVLGSTPATEREKIDAALDHLSAGGSTAGGEGIELAYQIAKENLIKGGNNRVILATDGDFNVGVSSTGDLVRLIEDKRKDDIYLTICGFGMGNYKDSRMEEISDAGNGNYFYIDNIKEAQKVFVTEMRANMFTIAKDVKIQVEFNPSKVDAYRLIGYEDRVLAKEDFDNDKKDAGELGAGHTVTAIYELVPKGAKGTAKKSAPLKYQDVTVKEGGNELMTLKLRYKPIHSDESILMERPLVDEEHDWKQASDNFRFAAAVAAFGMQLRDSKFKGDFGYADVLSLAKDAKGTDKEGYRSEFIGLIETASLLAANNKKNEEH